MRLDRAAAAFDRMPCKDAYTGKLAFAGQLGLYDDSKRDSETAERRVISTHPDVSIPTRRVVEAVGTHYIIGHGNPDSHRGRIIRIGWVAHEAPHFANVQTLEQACLDSGGLKAWCGYAWVKNLTDEAERSRLTPQCNVHFAPNEPVVEQQLIRLPDGQMFLTRNTRLGPAGTRIVLADQMPADTVQIASMQPGTFNPLTEIWTGSTDPVRVLRARWQSLFEYQHSGAPKFSSGDSQLVFSKLSITPKVGQKVGLNDGMWKIESVVEQATVWLCKAVRHA